MANAKGKEIDNTNLRLSEAHRRAFLHRDYLAHYLRWSHIAKYLNEKKRHKTAHILDVGCGKEFPLPRMLYANMLTHTTGSYTGVDYNKLDWPDLVPRDSKSFNVTVHGDANFLDVKLAREKTGYDVITSFEVLEHVEPLMAFHMLKRMRGLLSHQFPTQGRAFVSTPCFDPKVGAASNHVNEMSHYGFHHLILLAGFEVVANYGTFASQKDYKDLLDDAQLVLFERLRDYYDSQVLACIFAPLFPTRSRNCIWVLRRADQKHKLFPGDVKLLSNPQHSSSSRWATDIKKILKEAT